MANIGDLFYTFRGDGARLQADAKKEGEKAADAGAKSFAAKFKGGLKGAFSGAKGGLLGGIGLGAGLGAVSLTTQAVGQFIDVLGDAQQAYREDQASQAQLRASLEANSEAYTGNADVIEDVIEQRMRLGFADDEQRESLANLVSITKDHNEALELNRTAMDLARLRNIDLRTASDLVGKVYGGNIGILSRYGIQLKKGATATEALAEIQKRAAGQAEAYAETSEGKLLASQLKAGEAMEKLGKVMDRLVMQVIPPLVDGLTLVVDAFEALGVGVDHSMEDVVEYADRGSQAAEARLRGMAHDMGITVEQLRVKISSEARETAFAIRDTEGAWGDLEDAADESADGVENAATRMADSVEELRDITIGAARDIVEQAYEIIEDKAELTATNVEKAELRKAIATGKATAEQKERYRELTEAQTELILDLAENGQENLEVVDDAVAQLKEDLKTATGEEKRAIQALIALLEELERQFKNTGKAASNYKKKAGGSYAGPSKGGYGHLAAGGPTTAGTAYWVGEEGPELHVPKASGYVIPHEPSMTLAAQSAAPKGAPTYNVQLQGLPKVRSPRDIIDSLRMAGEQGYLGDW